MESSDYEVAAKLWLAEALRGLGHGAGVRLSKFMGWNPNVITRLKDVNPKNKKSTRKLLHTEMLRLQTWMAAEYRRIGMPVPAMPLPGEAPEGNMDLRRLSLDEEYVEDMKFGEREVSYTLGEYEPQHEGALPELDISAGAGEGIVGEVYALSLGDDTYSGHRVVAEWLVPKAYTRNVLEVSPKHSIIVSVIGDSMAPTLLAGDKVVVNLAQTAFIGDAIYLISDGFSAPQVKRLSSVWASNPPEVDIVSDNPLGGKRTAALSTVTILGRVAGRVTKQ